jgi:choline dehydrogenase
MTEDRGAYDYIIVGAGSAGCVLAARLSADPNIRVLLLEAGGHDRRLWVHIPLGYGKLFDHPTLNWRFQTDPEPGLNGRLVNQPRGKLLGGSSSVNGLVYVRGQHEDFDAWRFQGPVSWGFEDLLRYFRRAEHQVRGEDTWHGVDGPLWVSDQSEPHPLCEAFIAAAQQAGHPFNPDFNGAVQEGAGYYQTNTRNGLRCSTAVAYLHPARGRRNLTVLTHAAARRVILQDRRAVGVEWSARGALHQAWARAEVIVAAGAIKTPQLLQLSGVGPSALLKRLGIAVVHDSPDVGENFQDHLQVRLVYRAKRPVTLNDDMAHWTRTLRIGARYLLSRKGPLTVSAGYAGGFFRTPAAQRRPDIQVHFINFSTDKMGDRLHPFSGFTASSCQLRPTSRGRVRAISPDSEAAPSILANYLTTEEDCQANVAGLRLIRRIMGQSAMVEEVVGEEMPGPGIETDAALLAYARDTGGSIYHPSGSARMGVDARAVLSPELKVNGVSGLRVIDASIMPSLISGNANAVVIAIAERGSDLVLADRRAGRARNWEHEHAG